MISDMKVGDKVRLAPKTDGLEHHYGSSPEMCAIKQNMVGTIIHINPAVGDGASSYTKQTAKFYVSVQFPNQYCTWNYAEYELIPDSVPEVTKVIAEVVTRLEEEFYEELANG